MDLQINFTATVTKRGTPLAVVPLTGRLDAKTASEVRQSLQKIIDNGYPNLLIDLGQVSFMDSSGLGVLIAALRNCRAQQGSLYLCQVTEGVALVLSLTGMDRILPAFSDIEAGIAAFSPEGHQSGSTPRS